MLHHDGYIDIPKSNHTWYDLNLNFFLKLFLFLKEF